MEAVINTGIAGSLNKEINIGDIVLATDVLHHDMDATGFGYPKGQIPQMQEFSFPGDAAPVSYTHLFRVILDLGPASKGHALILPCLLYTSRCV